MCSQLKVLVLFLIVAHLGESARILGVFPYGAPSHYFLGNTLLKGLAEAGHDVTMISPFIQKSPPKNGTWRDIHLEGLTESLKSLFAKIDPFSMEKMSARTSVLLLDQMGSMVTEGTLKHKNVQELINSNEKFDVVILSQFMNDAMKAFASHFNAHLILFSNTASNSWLNHLVGNPSIPSFAPEIMLHLPEKMSFFQRIKNTFFKLGTILYLNLYLYPKHNGFIQKYFPNPVDINDLLYNVSLVLVNSHQSIFTAQPLVPSMIEIGGFHVQPSTNKVPEDLQKFLDDSKEGIIYFSMGSNFRSQNLPLEKREALLKTFSKRKEKVLWKWEDDVLPGQPPNVRLGKWLPQQDILAHPNVKLFLTHGGGLSTTETVYHGVPVVAIPIIGEQKMNAYNAERLGFGKVVSFADLSEEKLTAALNEILDNPKYTENVKERSRIMKDRPVKPLDSAVYWVEYVIRHNGAKHLRVPYLEMTWYQYYLLDVIAFIGGIILLTVIAIKKTYSYLRQKWQKRGEKTKTKKVKKH